MNFEKPSARKFKKGSDRIVEEEAACPATSGPHGGIAIEVNFLQR